ncbi:MAG: prolyl oligopeptidase family serine peptidase [Chitinophagaceae bacterium]
MKKVLLLCITIFPILQVTAQPLTTQDYARAVSFLSTNLFNKKVFNINTQYSWFADSTGVSFITQSPAEKIFNKLDWKKKKIEKLFDHEHVAKLLTDSLKKTFRSSDLPLTAVRYINATQIAFIAEGKEYLLNPQTYSLIQKKNVPDNQMESTSPDGKWVAYSKGYNLFIKSTGNGEVKQLSTAGVKNYEYATYYGWGELIEGENGERPPHFSVSWSPDSKWIGTYICDFRKGQKMYLLDWSIDTLYKPKLLSYYRGSPGDTDMVYMTPVFFNTMSGEEIRKDEFRNVNAASFEWTKEPGVTYIENRIRGYQQIDLFRANLVNKTQERFYSEISTTNIDNFDWQPTEDGKNLIVVSEKDGWKQLYLLILQEKKMQPITNGTYYVNDILFTDKKTQTIFFTASGKEKDRNPYYLHAYSIKMDGSGLTLLTAENANHDVSFSPGGKFFTDNISTLDQPTRSVLRESKTGKIVTELTKANIDAFTAMNASLPEPFTCTGRDGVTTIYGAIWKPAHFDAAKKYPVIDQTYTGPHTFMFPRNFVSGIARSNQALAELGFIVITVDGLGTANRSKAFHNFSYKNMGKNLTDHVIAIRELGKRFAWIDTSRVGIFGHSAGGYDAGHAVLEFPDFYKVAVASSGDHDFRMEKDWWPEMYMGWPVDSTYNQVSNITMAGNLKGKLLLVHGGIDENVNPSATFKLAEALVKADKEFDMLILPSQHHGYGGKYNEYFTKKKWNYFVEHLLGVQPIWDFELK